MKISIVIPAFNEEKYLPACLKSVLANKTEDVTEVLVVNNCSTDKTAEVAGRFPGIRVVFEPVKGLTRARQRGLEETSGDLLAFIDADTRIPPGWFAVLHREFTADPKLVCLSGPYQYFDLPPGKQVSTKIFQKYLYHPTYRMLGFLVLGGNFVAKKNALLKIGGFDRNIEFYGEDTDIAIRLHRTGRVKFSKDFYILTSGRRLAKEGVIRTGLRYMLNFVWRVLLGRPFSKTHKNIR